MAEKLSIQIALNGGAEIERQLADIGTAGQKAFADITKSAEQVGGFKNLKPEEVTAKLRQMGVTGIDAIDKIQAAVQKAGKLETLVRGITTAENGLAALGRAAIPVGGAIVAAMVAATKATISFAAEITKVNEQAMRLGQGIEQFDRMRRALEGAGVSAQGFTGFMERLGAAAAKANLDRVAKAIKEVQEAMARGAGGGAIAQTAAWQTLQQEATKATEAGKRARQMLVEVGAPIPTGAALTLGELTVKTGSVEAGLKAFVEQLRQMPSSVEANKASMDALGVSATQLITAYDNLAAKGVGAITPDMVTKADALTGAVNRLEAAWTRFGSVSFAPVITTQINTVTSALQALQSMIEGLSFQSVGEGILAVGNALGNLSVGQQILHGIEIIFPAIANAARDTAEAIGRFIQTLGRISWEAVSAVGVAAWNLLTGAIDGAATAVANFFSNLASGAWDKVKALLGLGGGAPAPAGGMARGGLLGGRGTGTSDSNLAWVSRGEYVTPAHVVRQPGVLSFLEALRRSGRIPGFAAGGIVGGGGTDVMTVRVNQMLQVLEQNTQAISSQSTVIIDLGRIVSGLTQTVAGLVQIIGDLVQQQVELVQKLSKKEKIPETVPNPFMKEARGGLLGGRGTGTSDSNLAWVSRGEHIMPARAVAQPGVLAFLEMLRRSGGNLSRVLDGMGRFALGGMVPRAIPAFAAGGLNGGMSNVTIQFPGLPAIGGLRTSSDVVDQLRKSAALAQVRSGGRKPSRYS